MPRARTARFAHVADVSHKEERRLGRAPVKLGEVYADRDGLRVIARRERFMLARGKRETGALAAWDLPGLRILADLDVGLVIRCTATPTRRCSTARCSRP